MCTITASCTTSHPEQQGLVLKPQTHFTRGMEMVDNNPTLQLKHLILLSLQTLQRTFYFTTLGHNNRVGSCKYFIRNWCYLLILVMLLPQTRLWRTPSCKDVVFFIQSGK